MQNEREFRCDSEKLRTLLTKFWLAFLHRCHDHVTDSGIRKTIQMRATTIGFYDIERLCTAVVGAVEDGTDGQTEGKPEFVTSSSCTCCRRYKDEKKREHGGVRRTALGHFVGWSRVWTMDDISRMWRELYSLSAFAIGCYFNLFGTSRVMSYSGKVHIRIRICTVTRMHTLSLVRYWGELIDND